MNAVRTAVTMYGGVTPIRVQNIEVLSFLNVLFQCIAINQIINKFSID